MGPATFSAIGKGQATGIGAISQNHPANGTVAISPAAFGLPYGSSGERAATQLFLRKHAQNVRIEAAGLDMRGSGMSTTSFTISDVGDTNIRNSPNVRFDIYRWKSMKAALKWGKRAAVTTIKNLPQGMSCPFGN